MASYKHNVGFLRSCLSIDELHPLLLAHNHEAYPTCGIADAERESTSVTGLLSVSGTATVKRLDTEFKNARRVDVSKDDLYLFRVIPHNDADKNGHLEVYDGGGSSIETVGQFLYSGLDSGIIFEGINIDLLATFTKLQTLGTEVALKSAKIAGYKHNDNTVGPYSPRFANTEDGLAFIHNHTGEGKATLKSINATLKVDTKKVAMTILPTGCLTISCKPDQEQPARELARQMLGIPTLSQIVAPAIPVAQPEPVAGGVD